MTDARSSGDGEEAAGGDGLGPLLRSIGERAPLTEAECELVGALSDQGLLISGLTLVREERTDKVFVQQMLPPAADGRGPPKAGHYDLDALTAEGTKARQRGRYEVAAPCLLLALRLRLRVFGLDDPETVMSLNDLGEALHEQGDLAGARELFEAMHRVCLRRVGTDHDYTLCAANNLAAVLFDQDHLAAACELQQTVYETLQRKAGAADPQTLAAANNLANMRLARGDLAGAHTLLLSIYGTLKQLLGGEHRDVLVCANSLSKTLLARGDVAEARLLLESTAEAQRRVEGPEHIRTLATANNLAEILRAQGDLKEALKLHRYVYEARHRVLGAEHMDTLASANNLGLTLQAQGDHAAARTLLETAYQAGRDRLGDEHSDTLTAALNLAETLRALDDFPGALKLQAMVHETRERLLGEEHSQTLLAANNRAGTLQVAGRLAEAGRLHERVHAILQRVLGPAHAQTVGSADNRSSLFQESGDLPRSAEICLSALDALTQAVAVDSTALTIAARLPILRAPHLAWPAASLAEVGNALPALSKRVMRQLRSMPLDSGASLFKAMLLLHDRWCVFVHHHAPVNQRPQQLLAAIGALHGTNAWAQLREAAQDNDTRSHSPAAQRYLQSEQTLQRSAQEIHELLQQRDALREQGAPGEALRPLQQQLDTLSRQDKLQYEALAEAERQLAAEDPLFAERMRSNEAIDWLSLQDSLDDNDAWLVPMPQAVIQLSDWPGDWAREVGERHSDVFVVRRHHPPSIVPTTSLPALVEATRFYRQGLQGTSRGLLRDGLPATPPDAAQIDAPTPTDFTLANGEEGPLGLVRYLTREGFWTALLPLLKGVRRLHLVTGPGQHDMMLECGLPEELADLQVLRYCGLPAYRRRLMVGPGEATARNAPNTAPLPEPTWICDPAWDSPCPIPFTTLDALLPSRQGRGRPQDVRDLLAHGPYSPLLVISSHGQSSGSRANPSGAILIGDVRIAAPMLAPGRHDQPHQVQRPTRFVVALSCFGGVVGSSSQGDAHGVIAALQSLGLRWAIACLAPVADFYTPLFSAVLHHELAKPGVDPADALIRCKRIVLHGPWDDTLRREALDPLRQGYRGLMQAILDDALSGDAAPGTEPSPRALRLLRSLLGWPIQANKIHRALASALARAAEEGRTEAVALRLAQGQIRDVLRQPGRRDLFIDDALDAVFSGPTGWAANREHGGPMTSCVTALQSLCAVTVFFGRQ